MEEERKMPELAYVNGNFMPIEEAVVPIEDRGYQFGDAVYEVVNSYGGKFFGLEEHLDRLERSMNALSFPPLSREKVRAAMNEILNRSGMDRASVYLQVSRGVAPRNHVFSGINDVQFIMTVRGVKEVPWELKEKGITAITVRDVRWGRCDIKTVQLVPNCLARQQAIDAGADDAIFLTDDDVVRESTLSNIFIVADGIVITHPANHNILNGITRMMVLDCCREIELQVEERFYTIKEMFAAAEVFLTGTSIEVLPIIEIDGRPIAGGKPGSVSHRLDEALRKRTGE
jgi:D-alanine transaminase